MANNSEEGQGPQRAVVPVMMMMKSIRILRKNIEDKKMLDLSSKFSAGNCVSRF
jgi:hypothetical protein